jgi:hypothetical protein
MRTYTVTAAKTPPRRPKVGHSDVSDKARKRLPVLERAPRKGWEKVAEQVERLRVTRKEEKFPDPYERSKYDGGPDE